MHNWSPEQEKNSQPWEMILKTPCGDLSAIGQKAPRKTTTGTIIRPENQQTTAGTRE
jgi:hypothetical protein